MKTIDTATQNSELLASLGEIIDDSTNPDRELEQPSSHYSPGVTSGLEEKARNLLGSGVQAEAVAAALGVTPSRISQLLSNHAFAESVAKLRYAAMQSHSIRDGKYDSLEDVLLAKLEKSMPLMIKPESILKAISIVNNAKRRGQASTAQVSEHKNIVQLVLPSVIADKFSLNINNQVTRAGDQELLTMPSGNLLKQVEAAQETKLIEQESTNGSLQEDRR